MEFVYTEKSVYFWRMKVSTIDESRKWYISEPMVSISYKTKAVLQHTMVAQG
jgi:hypothetical protein